MKKLIQNKFLTTCLALLVSMPLFAQSAETQGKNWFLSDGTFWLLLAVAVILFYVIYALAEVIIWGGKKRMQNNSGKTGMIALLLTAGLFFAGKTAEAQDVATTPAVSEGLLQSVYLPLYILIAIEVLVIGYLSIMLLQLSKREQLEATGKKETWISQLWEKWNYKVPIEREGEMLMEDHEYDGIRELDNTMPPWLQYIFFFTIGFAIVYMWYYHLGDGPRQEEEYTMSVEKAEVELAAYLEKAAANYDENSVVISEESAVLSAGKRTFEQYCVTCHGTAGEGTAAAPNLTDNYWIHGGKINDVFKTVKYGVQGKAMASWKEILNPKQIFEVSNYIHSLQGSNPPNAKAAEGTLYTETSSAPLDTSGAAAADTSAVVSVVQ